MKVLIASSDEATTQQIRALLKSHLADCPDESVVDPEIAASRAEMLHPDLVLVVLQPKSIERELGIVKSIKASTKSYLACIGPAADGKLIIRALHEGGADQYLDISSLDSELQETLRVVKSRIGEGAKQGKVIVMLGASGGSGASTLAVNMAAALAKKHQTCALLDFDVESGDLTSLLDLHGTQNLGDFCTNLNRIDRGLFGSMFTVHESGIHLMVSPRCYGGPLTVTDDGLRNAVLMSRSVFPRVVVDMKLDRSFRDVEDVILQMADQILIVFRMDLTSLRNSRKLIDRLHRLGIARERIEYVANRFGEPHDVPTAMAEDVLGIKITHFIPNDPGAINRANNNGVPLVMTSSWSTVRRSILSMSGSVDGVVGEPHVET